ncbi:hypothetical protein TSTA_040770 [Talaromyces stipitatus ATCC 10500]|uniref:HTH psq-type domain-containing protein n=1 Tax=Talaromyces stipitatus (strain ATCC 10500 / CBS 375.48 / QM 6759 / NRRL 1006) TaxID=441959 RepID=B8MIB4_TALSN|nr:uncharacterized protein TSTA_040770 [Talaromyces stipitatus ATCC 10500]EED14598.1 hypothetical protein TSTA_040770 [Talaromyces stipitatus ATCC 10500]
MRGPYPARSLRLFVMQIVYGLGSLQAVLPPEGDREFDNMVNEADILKAISDQNHKKKPKYVRTARRYNHEPATLRRRYKGQTVSNQEATSIRRKLLTDAQEEVLLNHISALIS